jgi:hypothetical protein
VERRPSINAVNSSRVRCEAGNLVAMGCSFAGLAKAQRDLDVLLVSVEVHIGGAFGFRSAINSANGRHR